MQQLAIALDRTLNKLYALCGAIAAVAIIVIAVLVTTSIIARLLGVYIGGLTEGAGYAMAAAGSFGLAYTLQSGGHIRVDLALNTMRPRVRRIAELVALVLTTCAVLYLAWFMLRMVHISREFGDLSDGSDGLPLWLPQLPAAVGFSVFAIALIHNLVSFCITGKTPWNHSRDQLLVERETDK